MESSKCQESQDGMNASRALGQRCQDDRGSYTQCCEVTRWNTRSGLCLFIFVTEKMTHLFPMGGTAFSENTGFTLCCFHLIWHDAWTLGSGRHENNGFLIGRGLECLVLFSSPAAGCSVYRSEQSKASRPSLLGVWSWMAPEDVGVGGGCSIIHRAQLLTTVCLSSGALNICWSSFLLRWTFHVQNLRCEVKFSGPGGGQEGHLSTQHHPLPHGWTCLRIYSAPSLCGCGRKGLEWDWSFRVTWSRTEELETSPTLVPAPAARDLWVPYSGCVQCAWYTLEPSPTMSLFWAL